MHHIREDWTVDMGRDKDRNRLPGRTVDAHLYFDLRRHADQAASLDEKVFAIEDKAAKETFAEVGKIRAIRLPGGDRLLREVTKRQREWIAAIGLPPVTV